MMDINGNNIQIMWKEIAIILLIVFALRLAINIYIKTIYNMISNKFYAYAWTGLEESMRKHKKICDFFSKGPWNKNIYLMYNGLCVSLASIALMRNDEEEFIRQLYSVKRDVYYEIQPFILMLYYYSRNDKDRIKKYYNKYLQCERKDKNIQVVAEFLLLEDKKEYDEIINDAILSFRNPAIIKLFKESNLII